ncbi:MAG: hypothetical protein KJ844_11130 [Candidatus Edwardsbacteria bacterium]|nr:hypothetical protein [Candidatus Edwardsbacteria bacterium]
MLYHRQERPEGQNPEEITPEEIPNEEVVAPPIRLVTEGYDPTRATLKDEPEDKTPKP